MEGVFLEDDPDMPNMSASEIWSHVKDADALTFWKLSQLPLEIRSDKKQVLEWLQGQEPVLYETLRDILSCFQNAYLMGCEARANYLQHYQRWLLARRAIDPDEDPLEEQMRWAAEDDAGARSEKRKKSGEPKENIEKQVKQMKTAANRVQKKAPPINHLFYTQENFSSDFPVEKYRHFVAKGKRPYTQEQVKAGSWETVYHCSGPWNAEQLTADLEQQGFDALIMKKLKGGPDAEVMGFKVLKGRINHDNTQQD